MTVGVVLTIAYFLLTAGTTPIKEGIIVEVKDGIVQAVHSSEDINIIIVEYDNDIEDSVSVKFMEPDSVGYHYKEIYLGEPEVLKEFEKLVNQRNK